MGFRLCNDLIFVFSETGNKKEIDGEFPFLVGRKSVSSSILGKAVLERILVFILFSLSIDIGVVLNDLVARYWLLSYRLVSWSFDMHG